MTPSRRTDLTRALAYYLVGLGFRNVRSQDNPRMRPLPLDGVGEPFVPDATTRSGTGRLSVYLVVSAEDLGEEEHVGRVRLAAAVTEHHGARFWVVAPRGERGRVKRRLDELGIAARMLEV